MPAEWSTAQTDRLIVRVPVEADRAEMVPMWQDNDFMSFSAGVLDETQANARFDRMLERCGEIAFAKQAIVERGTGRIIGYTGVDTFEFEGSPRLEWGYRLLLDARGKGYASEAGRALIDVARSTIVDPVTVLAMIDPRNEASQNVARKIGFGYWKMATVNGFLDQIWRQTLQPTR